MSLEPDAIRARRSALKLTQASLGDLIGVSSNTIARWESGAVAIPEPAARLLRVLVELAGVSERQAERALSELRDRVAAKRQ